MRRCLAHDRGGARVEMRDEARRVALGRGGAHVEVDAERPLSAPYWTSCVVFATSEVTWHSSTAMSASARRQSSDGGGGGAVAATSHEGVANTLGRRDLLYGGRW